MALIKLIVTDLDGTFLADAKAPHPENVRAMHACQEAGIPVCALTGRNWAESKRIVFGSNFDRFCGINNGTAIVDSRTEELRYRNRFHPDDADALIRLLLAMDGVNFCVTGTMQHHSLNGRQVRPYLDPAEAYLEDASVAPVVFYDTEQELMEQSHVDAQRLFIDLPNTDEATRNRIFELANLIVPVGITYFSDGIEIVPEGASKADVMGVLADIYNVRLANVMAFGDNLNDLSMVKAAGVGVAMENGEAALKSEADCIAPNNTEGGFAKIIWQMVL